MNIVSKLSERLLAFKVLFDDLENNLYDATEGYYLLLSVYS